MSITRQEVEDVLRARGFVQGTQISPEDQVIKYTVVTTPAETTQLKQQTTYIEQQTPTTQTPAETALTPRAEAEPWDLTAGSGFAKTALLWTLIIGTLISLWDDRGEEVRSEPAAD